MGPRAGLEGCEKYRPTAKFSFLSLQSFPFYFLISLLSLFITLSLLSTHTTQTSMPPVGFFYILLYSVCTSFYLFLCFHCPSFCFLPLLTTDNTNIHAPGGIRTRNPSKRSAADPRLRPLGHWDR